MGEKHTQKKVKKLCEFHHQLQKKGILEFFNKFAQTVTKKIEIATTTTAAAAKGPWQ